MSTRVAQGPSPPVSPGQRVAISMCDGTRPQPGHLMIPVVLEELEGIVALSAVVVLVATGPHRGNSEAELRRMLGDEVYDGAEVVNHDTRDDASRVSIGRHGRGVPVLLNRRWVEADVRVTTGFVEPHFLAGSPEGPSSSRPGWAPRPTPL